MYEGRGFDSRHFHQRIALKIITKRVQELTSKEYKQCCSLTMRHHGLMMYTVQEGRTYSQNYVAILAMEGDTLIGWALLTPTKESGQVFVSDYARKMSRYSVQFYVRKRYRRQGVARTLMNEALRHDSRPHVIPWDSGSAAFFVDYTVTADRERRGLMNRQKARKKREIDNHQHV